MKFLLNVTIYFSLSISYLYGNNSVEEKFKYLEVQTKNQAENFKSSENRKQFNKYSKLNKNRLSLREQLELSKDMYISDDFLTKDEHNIIGKDINNAIKELKKPKDFLLYFFSESVPRNSVANFLLSVDILKQNGIDIDSKQYMVGAPEEYEQYMNNWKIYLDKYPTKYQSSVADNFFMKLDPRFFKGYEINSVPAIAFATCASIIPDPSSCRIKYLIHGDVPLTTFFDKISKIDKKYQNYNKFLDANGIFKSEVKHEK